MELNPNKTYLVTGASGFLGKALVKRLVGMGITNLVAISRNEGELVKLKEMFPTVQIVPGSIGDMTDVKHAMRGVSGIFHLAAMKHVGLAEENPRECVITNVVGTMNLLEVTRAYETDFIVGLSTDKASCVKGVYGATKLLLERLFIQYSKLNPKTQYRVVRYGNVWNSTGSFITKWLPKLERHQEITLTDPTATRFFFTVEEAVDLVFKSLSDTETVLKTPELKAASMGTVLEACQEVYGKCPVKVIGLQPGENLHETMDGKTYSNEVEHYTKDEFIKEFLT